MFQGEIAPEVKSYIVAHCEGLTPGDSDADVAEALIERHYKHEVWRGEEEDMEWFFEFVIVVKLGDRFIAFPYAKTTGHKGLDEVGWAMYLPSITFVHPVEKTIVVYERG